MDWGYGVDRFEFVLYLYLCLVLLFFGALDYSIACEGEVDVSVGVDVVSRISGSTYTSLMNIRSILYCCVCSVRSERM